MERIYQGGPWLFENHMLILRKVQFGEDPAKMPMDSTEIWCQVHQLPFGFMSEPMGRLVGNHIGKYVKYDDLYKWIMEEVHENSSGDQHQRTTKEELGV
ncbi:hypothetical protein A2U01_0023827 [Trifolium medium]|uniref:Uncharacterized protein n=1 Tax=Trifolium medium TaxID=97028 RepID=A0A392NSJ3_9FABA|nr:hypothetical protein [Trifolium medium]